MEVLKVMQKPLSLALGSDCKGPGRSSGGAGHVQLLHLGAGYKSVFRFVKIHGVYDT